MEVVICGLKCCRFVIMYDLFSAKFYPKLFKIIVVHLVLGQTLLTFLCFDSQVTFILTESCVWHEQIQYDVTKTVCREIFQGSSYLHSVIH